MFDITPAIVEQYPDHDLLACALGEVINNTVAWVGTQKITMRHDDVHGRRRLIHKGQSGVWPSNISLLLSFPQDHRWTFGLYAEIKPVTKWVDDDVIVRVMATVGYRSDAELQVQKERVIYPDWGGYDITKSGRFPLADRNSIGEASIEIVQYLEEIVAPYWSLNSP